MFISRLLSHDRHTQIAPTSGTTSSSHPLLIEGRDFFLPLSRSQAGHSITFSAFRSRTFSKVPLCGSVDAVLWLELIKDTAPGFEYGPVNNAILPRRIQRQVLSQEMIFGHTSACAWRPSRIPRCCKETPTSPGYSMIRTFSTSIASVNGLIEAEGATSSAVFTTAIVTGALPLEQRKRCHLWVRDN